jgi:NAD(P)-dependent dehydrogenase (short-subunit alcohol dehydrogenase family)
MMSSRRLPRTRLPGKVGMEERKRCILVTGACGGLGFAVTAGLAARGVTVFASDADRAALAGREWAPGVVPLPMDVTNRDSVAEAIAEAGRATDSLHGIACCAGIFTGGPLVEVDCREVMRILEVNVVGVQRVVSAAFPLLARGGATVVTISSEAVRCAVPFNGPYMMSKCALEAYSATLRRELSLCGIRVVVVQPGAIRTRLLLNANAAFARMEAGSAFGAQLRLARAALDREWRKGMEPGEVAEVVVRALMSGRPRLLYRVGNDPSRSVLGMMPRSLADALIRRFMR